VLRSALASSGRRPFGPIRFDYAIPVLKEKTDIVQNLNFGVSTRF
jgi:outer membrane protein insertion porin family